MGVIKMTEKAVKDLKFGETVSDGNGNKYTKTIGGWIYQTFSGQVCFVPAGIEEPITEKADKKANGK
jgi:hypothetical protein